MKLQVKGASLYADRLYVELDRIYLHRRRQVYIADRQGILSRDWWLVALWPHGVGATRGAEAEAPRLAAIRRPAHPAERPPQRRTT